MKGKPEVLAELSERLKEELAAINQYILHAEMCENWGYSRLARQTKQEAIGEMKHAEKIIERLLFLEGLPRVDQLGRIKIGKNVKEQLANDLALERGAVADYNKSIDICRKASDNATVDFLKEILKDEEEHVDTLETELSMIEQMGFENYLAQQMEEGGSK
ncbi:MAG TPA: bacterioferritin [Patescibacteria group bacterium]|nr:bacterioferritin [Patescibacteria group bacterium]